MERLLLLWDEFDDLTGAGRYLMACAASEIAGLAVPLASAACAVGAGLLAMRWPASVGLMQGAGAPWTP